jgi:hypothetical protein
MGKGSKRRNEDTQKINDNWDLIFGKKDKETKDIKEESFEKKTTESDKSTKTK